MTQAAVWALTQSLWTELREFGVGVSCLLPGYYQSYGWTLPEGSEAGDTGVMNEVKMQAATATLSAQDVAAYLLKNVAKGKFDIIPPGEEKWLYWLHRIWPAASRQLRWYKFSNILNQRRKIGRKYAKWLRDQKTTQRKAVTGYIVSKRERLLQ
jgi:short-subunit dehydrogenase